MKAPSQLGARAGIKAGAGRCSGFSLVELMAVLVVIAIMAVMIVPEMRGTYGDALLRSSARKLISACHLANSRAIALHLPQRLRVDAKTGRYFTEPTAPEGGASDRESGNAARFRPIEGRIDSRVTIEIGGNTAEPRTNGDEAMAPNSQAPPESAELLDPMAIEGAGNLISFLPDGTAQGPEIVLRDREGFRLALRVHPTTARVRVTELARE
jgi:prepilin-type N-terminal cleavage/methylation domain-containing protein